MAREPATLTAAPALNAAGRPALNATARERPVFLDESGRRARFVRLGGRLMGIATAAWLGALVLGASAPQALPSLSSQLASIRGVSPAHVAAAHGLGENALASPMTFARLTTRPDLGSARVTADVETRAVPRV
jgi:hypothetical protein